MKKNGGAKMKVLIDADACPVTDIAVKLCAEFGIECTLFCDTAHQIQRNGAITMIFDKGADNTNGYGKAKR